MSPEPRDYYATEIATAGPGDPVGQLAAKMAEYAVGCVVIVDGERRPVGVVTDRDLACRVVATGHDAATPARAVMSAPPVLARTDEPIEAVAARMREAGVRRLPVVRDTTLVGLVALDDLVVHLGRELEDLGAAARRAITSARARGRRQRRVEELEEHIAALRSTLEGAGRDAVAFVTREFEALRERLQRPR